MTEITATNIFPTHVYSLEAPPEYLKRVREISLHDLDLQTPDIDPIFPVRMSGDLEQYPDMREFCQFVGKHAHRLMIEQGYAVKNKSVYFSDLWCQEHHKGSSMEQHVHGKGSQLVGFYFIDVPEDSMTVAFHDPRSGKVQSEEYEEDPEAVTYSNSVARIFPYPGLLVFTNAWLPHSFSRNRSNDPVRFIHFNVGVVDNLPEEVFEVEIV